MIKFEQPLLLLAGLILACLIGAQVYLRRRKLLKRELSDRLSIALRVLALILLILTLAGPKLGSQIRMNYVYFVVDLSGSLSSGMEPKQILERVEELKATDEHTSYGLILFGEEPYIESGFLQELSLDRVNTVVPSQGTDIPAALRLALDTFPQQGGKEIVLLSDGNLTTGELAGVLARAKEEGVEISVLPLSSNLSRETILDDLILPKRVAVGTPYQMKIRVFSFGQLDRANLVIYRNGRYLSSEKVELKAGLNSFEVQDKVDRPGSYYYQAFILVDGDTLPNNNSLSGITEASGGPQLLLLDRGYGSVVLEELLSSSGYSFEVQKIADFGASSAEISFYKAIILNNVELNNLSKGQIEGLERYVRDSGGGLLLVQGYQAVKELASTELEKVLPVSYEGQREETPSIAIIFLLDRSSSMGAYAGGVQKIELLKEAAAASVEILEEGNLIGMIAFNRDYSWAVDIQPAEAKEEIYERIKELQAAGGTDLFYPLQEAFQRLERVNAKIKHILVFSDGKVLKKGRDFTELLSKINRSDITVSAIGIGESPDVEMLRSIVESGRGKLYLVDNIENLPRVSVEETQRIKRERWITGEVQVIKGPDAHLLEREQALAIPPLEGYVLTYPKPTSETALISAKGDPLVSFWQYGLGRVGVLNTDLEGMWSRSWTSWEELPALFGEIVGQVYGEPRGSEKLGIETAVEGSDLKVIVDVQEDGRWDNLLDVEGVLSFTDRSGRSFPLEQVAPGRYQAEVSGLEEGVYLLNLIAKRDDQEIAVGKKAVVVPYPEEFRRLGLNEDVLEEIAAATGGEYIEDELPPLFVGKPVFEYQELWRIGLLLVTLLFVTDLILRKIPFR